MAPRTLCLSLLLCVACGDDDRLPTDAGTRDLGSDMGTRDGATPTDASAGDDAATGDDGGTSDAGTAEDGGAETADLGSVDDDGGAPLDCVDGPLTLDSERSATTIGGPEVRDPDGDDCVAGFATGPERVFSFTAPDADDFRVTVTPNSGTFDPMIYVQQSCDDSVMCIAGSNLNGEGTADSTTMTLGAGETALITVDTDLGGDIGGGPFTILVERAP
jgi:hypothetical protein